MCTYPMKRQLDETGFDEMAPPSIRLSRQAGSTIPSHRAWVIFSRVLANGVNSIDDDECRFFCVNVNHFQNENIGYHIW